VFLARLEMIRKDNGYQTDAGSRIYIGENPVLGEADPEASLAVVVKETEVGHQGERVVETLPVEVQAIVRADASDPRATTEAVIADIKTAVEKDHDLNHTLIRRGLERGKTRPFPREDGSQYVGATVEYRLMYAEDWGRP
jgi:hypothetical protein